MLFTDGVSPRVAGHRKVCSAGADCRDLSLVEPAHYTQKQGSASLATPRRSLCRPPLCSSKPFLLPACPQSQPFPCWPPTSRGHAEGPQCPSPLCLPPPRLNSIQNRGRWCPRKRAGWPLSVPFRPAARFLSHPRHRRTSGGRAALGCLWARHTRWKAADPGVKPTEARESQLLERRCALQTRTRVS